MSQLQLAIEQVAFARNYTLGLLEQTPTTEWFRQPPGGITHIAWQVGHLTFAEYRMALWRIRGTRPEDAGLISEHWVHLFGYDSVPDADATRYPSQGDIRAAFDRMHEKVLGELRGLNEAELEQPVLHPHPFAQTKFQALLWCAHHEMMHAGQIGLLRRQLGYAPMR